MRLNHNLDSLNVYREYSRSVKLNGIALNHVVTGEKISKASDAPNQIAKSERMRLQIRGFQMAQRNLQDGVSMIQTADGSLSGANSILNRVRELVVQYGSGANSEGDKRQIKKEINEMINAYSDITNNTEFNGVKLFSHGQVDKLGEKLDKIGKPMQIGSQAGENMDFEFFDLGIEKVGVREEVNEVLKVKKGMSLKDLKSDEILKDPKFIDKALEIVDGAISQVVDVRSKYGAINNKFDGLISNLSEFEIQTQKAESSIRDADVAEEMAQYAKTNILIEASKAIMTQTNKFPQDVLRILETSKR